MTQKARLHFFYFAHQVVKNRLVRDIFDDSNDVNGDDGDDDGDDCDGDDFRPPHCCDLIFAHTRIADWL